MTRLDWEVNGPWFPSGPDNPVTGANAADYVSTWRRVRDIFTSVGTTNVAWARCRNIDPWMSFTDLYAVAFASGIALSIYSTDTFGDFVGAFK